MAQLKIFHTVYLEKENYIFPNHEFKVTNLQRKKHLPQAFMFIFHSLL